MFALRQTANTRINWPTFAPPNGRILLRRWQTFVATVRGWGVPYSSTREREVSRAVRTMRKIEGQKLSKYARKPTRERQWQRSMKAAGTYDAWEETLMEVW